MGLFDSLKNVFAHHEHHHGAAIGQPLTLADAKVVLASLAVHQHLADMRKVAEAIKQVQDELPQYVTFGMSHYYSEPKRVRFQSEGGKFIDADAIATAYGETTVLQDECEIQHLMGDIEDNREHRDPAKTPAVPIDELVRITGEKLSADSDEPQRRAWLFALYDQLADIDEATKHNLEPLAAALTAALPGMSSSGTAADAADTTTSTDDARANIVVTIVDALFPATDSTQPSDTAATDATPSARTLMLDPTATSLDYMKAVEFFQSRGLSITGTAA